MRASEQLRKIKIIHTIIWLFFNAVIFYLLYAVVVNQIDRWVWICLALVSLEALTLLIFKRICPITVIARRYSKSSKDNFDIYLPNWLARYNKAIYSAIVLVAVAVLTYRLINNYKTEI